MSVTTNILRLSAVIAITGLSRSTIYSLVNRGEFPQRVYLSPRAMGFLESEVDAWVNARVAASRING
ncbi:MAG: helix-turn-helix transcriptional regulator [Methylovulum sp.]|nr:AlpA family transcriptional regulator [Methylococcales bacterium]